MRRLRAASPEVGEAARQLRLNPTPAERMLWKAIRRKAIGGRFRRQHPMGRFILDFYCPAARLCLELDGGYHAEQVERDAERDAWLRAAGVRVLRIPNASVLNSLPQVLTAIEAELG